MNPTGKKFISLFLVFSLMMISVNLYAKERRGAKLIITKKDGQLIEGELIIVKPTSLLSLDTYGKDVSIDIADIKVIRIVKKSKIWKGAVPGILIGVVTGTIVGVLTAKESFIGPTLNVLAGGVYYGFFGLLIGGAIGAIAIKDEIIQIEGRTSLSIEYILDKLRKKARIRNYK
jgi:hypothetical protein